MKGITTQILIGVAIAVVLFKGGLALVATAWKLVLPVVLLGGAYYFGKKYFAGAGELSSKKDPDFEKVNAKNTKEGKTREAASAQKSGVIEICPHCLSEVGSCSKCR